MNPSILSLRHCEAQSTVPRIMRCGWSAVLGSTVSVLGDGGVQRGELQCHCYPQSLIAKIADQDGKSRDANHGLKASQSVREESQAGQLSQRPSMMFVLPHQTWPRLVWPRISIFASSYICLSNRDLLLALEARADAQSVWVCQWSVSRSDHLPPVTDISVPISTDYYFAYASYS
jgi:hypothetical protein